MQDFSAQDPEPSAWRLGFPVPEAEKLVEEVLEHSPLGARRQGSWDSTGAAAEQRALGEPPAMQRQLAVASELGAVLAELEVIVKQAPVE